MKFNFCILLLRVWCWDQEHSCKCRKAWRPTATKPLLQTSPAFPLVYIWWENYHSDKLQIKTILEVLGVSLIIDKVWGVRTWITSVQFETLTNGASLQCSPRPSSSPHWNGPTAVVLPCCCLTFNLVFVLYLFVFCKSHVCICLLKSPTIETAALLSCCLTFKYACHLRSADPQCDPYSILRMRLLSRILNFEMSTLYTQHIWGGKLKSQTLLTFKHACCPGSPDPDSSLPAAYIHKHSQIQIHTSMNSGKYQYII